ncbi:unnamed protein product [Lactuca virosa]|uniref:ATP-dependent DNA helicase n=1 Tax=Lactuca virosa TaxID=75947 RepID=A0AAU9N593_9ASTR|nr:unnamed protein product [Lactuca virosa]
MVNGEICPSFRDACYALGLLDDDKEYIEAIKEASQSGSGYYLRFLFATMLLSHNLSSPDVVWENTWVYLSDGILYNQQQRLKSPDLSLNEDQIKNLALFEIEQILLRNNSSLKKFTRMPLPDADSVSSSNNRLISEELDYNIPNLKNEFDQLSIALTSEQQNIFDDIMTAINNNEGGVFFVYGYGGTELSRHTPCPQLDMPSSMHALIPFVWHPVRQNEIEVEKAQMELGWAGTPRRELERCCSATLLGSALQSYSLFHLPINLLFGVANTYIF